MENSKIEWTHHTCNFWYGCTKVSPACDHCYAETKMDTRFHRVEWGADRVQTGRPVRRAPFKWDRMAAAAGERHRVFTLSLGDFFDNEVPSAWRDEAWNTIRACRNLDWLILTKRPQNIRKMLPTNWGQGWGNVWLGTTVENMTEARRRLPVLLRVPAVRHFGSCEPMLEPLDLRPWLGRDGLDWVICGGETGGGARMMEPASARALRDQCADHGAAFFLKQMTRKAAIPLDLMVRQFPAAA